LSNFIVNPYNFAVAVATDLCNGAGRADNVSSSAGYIRASQIDVSSVPSPFTPTQLSYTADFTMSGNVAIGLYTNSAGSPGTLICQTASTAIAGSNTTPTYVATTTSPSTTHSGLLWIGTMTESTASGNFKGANGITPMKMKYQANETTPYTYPTFPTTFVVDLPNTDFPQACLSYT